MLDLESIPHVEELIIANCDAQGLLKCRSVSRRWKETAERVLINRYKDNAFLAVENNEVGVIKLLLEHPECADINWNITRHYDIAKITPLMLACRNGLTKIVELFLDHSVTKKIYLHMEHILGDPTKEGVSAIEGDNGEYYDKYFGHGQNGHGQNEGQRMKKKYGSYTAFTYACHFGHQKVVELMLAFAKTNYDILIQRQFGRMRMSSSRYEEFEYEDTSFVVACRRGNTEVVKLLHQHTEKIELKDSKTAFRLACEYEHIDVIRLLLNHSAHHSINMNDVMLALMCACKDGHKSVVQLLLEHSPKDIELNTEYNGMSALMCACKNGRIGVVQLLLERSHQNIELNKAVITALELNAKAYDGMTALMYACQNGHRSVVQLLLEHSPQNIELNAKAKNGMTALMYACTNGHRGVVQVLLEHSPRDIELNAVDNKGNTAFWWACSQSCNEVVKLMFDKVMLGLDIKVPADNHFIPGGKEGTVFSSNVRELHRQYQKWMQAKNGWTPFMTACRFGRKDSVNFILVNRRKIDLNARDNSGRTGFMLAYSNGHKDVVELLRGYSTSMNIDISID